MKETEASLYCYNVSCIFFNKCLYFSYYMAGYLWTYLIYYIFSYAYIPMIKFNLQVRYSKRLTTVTNNKIKQL